MDDLQLFEINGFRRVRLHKANGFVHPSVKAVLEAAMPGGSTVKGVSWTQNSFNRPLEEETNSKWAKITLTYDHAQALSQVEKDALQTALDGHDGDTLITRDTDCESAIAWKRGELTAIDWSATALTTAERKLILNRVLTTIEEDAFISEWVTAGSP